MYYMNGDGDFTVKKLCTDENGEKYVKYKTFQGNGWIRVFIRYANGDTDEYFEYGQ